MKNKIVVFGRRKGIRSGDMLILNKVIKTRAKNVDLAFCNISKHTFSSSHLTGIKSFGFRVADTNKMSHKVVGHLRNHPKIKNKNQIFRPN